MVRTIRLLVSVASLLPLLGGAAASPPRDGWSRECAGARASAERAVQVIDEDRIRQIAKQVAQACFTGQGLAKSALDYGRMTVRFDAAVAGSDHPRDRWYVVIPEARGNVEPSGLQLSIDAETGQWTRPIVE